MRRSVHHASVLLLCSLLPLGCTSSDAEPAEEPNDTGEVTPPAPMPTPMPTPAPTPPAPVPPTPAPTPTQPDKDPDPIPTPPATSMPTPTTPVDVPKLDCTNPATAIVCNDGSVCNGVERCAPDAPGAGSDGCVKGTAVECAAGSTCSEATGQCSTCSVLSDADGDGHLSASCGGDDCDDSSALVHPNRAELCDGIDNDCSGAIDDGASSTCSAPEGGSASCVAGQCIAQCNVPGYVNDGKACVAAGSCAGATCDQGTCQPTLTSYVCTCAAGYVGSGTQSCVDIDECATANGGCEQTCVNTPGAFTCACATDYTLAADGKSCTKNPPVGNPCDNVLGCAPGNCVPQGATYSCECPTGYSFDGTACVDVDECADGSSGCSHSCTNKDGGFLCGCPSNMALTGTQCRDFAWQWSKPLARGGQPFNLRLAMNDQGEAVVAWDESDSAVGVGSWASVSYRNGAGGTYFESAVRFAGGWTDGSFDYTNSVHVDDQRRVTAVWINYLADAAGDQQGIYTRDYERGSWAYHTWSVSRRLPTYVASAEVFGVRTGTKVGVLFERAGSLQVRFKTGDVYTPLSPVETLAQNGHTSRGFVGTAAVDTAGVATVVYANTTEGGVGSPIYFRRQVAGAWTPAVDVDPGYLPTGNQQPVLLANRAGGTYLLWEREGAIHATRLLDDGTNGVDDLPSAGVIAPPATGFPLRAAAGNFNITALWAVERVGGSDLVASSWAPSGQWLAPVVVNDGSQQVTQAEVMVEPSGRALIVYLADQQLWARYLNGDVLDPPVRLDDERGPVAMFRAAMDSAGRVALAWRPATLGSGPQIFVRSFE